MKRYVKEKISENLKLSENNFIYTFFFADNLIHAIII